MDQVWAGCAVPAELLYDLELHVWVRFEGDEAVLGMTDVAQTMAGRLVAVSWKRPGRQLRRGQSIAVVESAKWVGPFPAALAGRLLAVNREAFEDDIAVANRDPYGAGWMARVAPTESATSLVDGTDAFEFYRRFVEENEIHCFRCEQE